MNCDRIAPFYGWIERAAFGRRLESHRLYFMAAAQTRTRALVLGDGDGRFTAAMAEAYPALAIDSIDISGGMLAQARRRVPERVHLMQRDILRSELPEAGYDIVFTHFFLDCFDGGELAKLIPKIADALSRDAVWVISDFKRAPGGWRKLYTSAWLTVMYRFFGVATGLKTTKLAPYEALLGAAGFRLRSDRVSRDGLIASEWWER